MREIKFRAWDNKNMEMIYPDGNGYFNCENHSDFVLCGNGYPIDLVHFNEPEDIVLMQYVGLKDKNGKDIYEGDILGKNGHNYSVCYKSSCARYWARKEDNTGLPLPDIIAGIRLNYAVIGNIWEDPGLFRGKQ